MENQKLKFQKEKIISDNMNGLNTELIQKSKLKKEK